MHRAFGFLTVLCFGSVISVAFCFAQSEVPSVDTWADRLVTDAMQISGIEGLKPHEKTSLCLSAARALALVGRVEKAISLARANLGEKDLSMTLVLIADAQSTGDDVAGAYRTADLLPEGRQPQYTRAIIAIRQAQRGDFTDGIALLDQISNPNERDEARRIIINELLEAELYREAAAQYSLIKDGDERERARQSMEDHRKRAEPGDAEYIERTIEKTRRLKGKFTDFSDDDAALLRLECQARIAIHEKDEMAFRQSIDEARRLIADWDSADRCLALLSIGAICGEFGDRRLARDLFSAAFDLLLQAGNVGIEDPHARIYFGLAAGDRFEMIAQVMPGPELHSLSTRIVAVDGALDLLEPLGRGIGVNGKAGFADDIYKELRDTQQRVQFSSGVLDGIAKRVRLQALSSDVKTPTEVERQQGISAIDRIIAAKPPLKFNTTGTRRPKRDFLGLYNVSSESIREYKGEIWQEAKELPDLSREEFDKVRSDVVVALWSHGSVYGFPTTDGDPDFFVWEDKFSDRTVKIEVKRSEYLPEILAPAVAELQKVLAEHPMWRVMILGHGERARDEFFVVYPDAIRILQADKTDSMVEAIKANAVLRMGKDE